MVNLAAILYQIRMKKTFTLSIILLLITTISFGQNKKELIRQKEELKSQLDSVTNELYAVKRKVSTAEVKADSFKAQVEDLKNTNATLLSNIESFTALSNQKSANLSQSLESMKTKDMQLEAINKSLYSRDSVVLILVTKLNKALQNVQGSNAAVTSGNGNVVVTFNNDFLFDEKGIKPTADSTVESIAAVLQNEISNVDILIESQLELSDSLTRGKNWMASIRKASYLGNRLENKNKLAVSGLKSFESESMNIDAPMVTKVVLQPALRRFYDEVKSFIKN